MKGGLTRLEDMDKTIEVIKAAMKKEEDAMLSEESMDKRIDEQTAEEQTAKSEIKC